MALGSDLLCLTLAAYRGRLGLWVRRYFLGSSPFSQESPLSRPRLQLHISNEAVRVAAQRVGADAAHAADLGAVLDRLGTALQMPTRASTMALLILQAARDVRTPAPAPLDLTGLAALGARSSA